MTQRVLVTGGTGFIAGNSILRLLEQGFLVRATVRSLEREPEIREALAEAGMADGANLSFAEADLLDDAGWAAAAEGSDFVLHTASPVRPGPVADEESVVVPAVEGTRRVLRAARDAGASRVVVTSAFHAVGWGRPRTDHVFTEADWTVLDGPGVDAYGRSKTLAERAAWDFVAAEGGGMELATVLPVAVTGPVLGSAASGANRIVLNLLNGRFPGYPSLWFPIVDVRDVAAAHVAAMTAPAAAGERFLLSNPAIPMERIGAVLREHLGDAAAAVPTRTIPNELVDTVFTGPFRLAPNDLDNERKVSNAKARSVLGFDPRSAEEAIVAAGRSMVAKGLVEP